MASRRKERQEDVHLRVLRQLNENPEMSTRQLADIVGISNGAAYYCLTALVEKGMVKLGNFASASHKGRYAYILTRRGIREKARLTIRFLERKHKEYIMLQQEIEELQAEIGVAPSNAPSNKINL